MVLGQFCSDHLGRLLLLATTAWDEVATNIQNCCQDEQKFKKYVAFWFVFLGSGIHCRETNVYNHHSAEEYSGVLKV